MATIGPRAFDRLEQANIEGEPFHLMLLDSHMPGEDGGKFLIKCREDSRFTSLPIIMVTSENDPESIRMAMNQGATSYIVKPVSYADLKKTVTQAFQRPASAATSATEA